MTYLRTIVGLFNEASAAQVAVEHLLEAGFAPSAIKVATQETLRAQHLPTTETFAEGIVRFFTEVFTDHPYDPKVYVAALRPSSAVVAVSVASDTGATRARTVLDTYGAVDVYKQAAAGTSPTADRAPGDIDLTGGLSRVRDADELDTNGLTTH
jgi:predicted SnoaL-like aldol condensation-catalyzing enzyme